MAFRDILKDKRNQNIFVTCVSAVVIIAAVIVIVVSSVSGVAELKKYRNEAIAELNTLYDIQEEYTSENYEKIKEFLTKAADEINKAPSKRLVDEAKAAANDDLKGVQKIGT
ncbi:MAG: hypothetical protein LBT30_05350 [Clostridiales bacterium]|jgi:predicted PurR-regulated permease PerM|nr:hypothetical protein [Clostridiales bacterium]